MPAIIYDALRSADDRDYGYLFFQQIGDNAGRMIARINLVVNALDHALLIDKIAEPVRLAVFGVRAGAVRERNGMISVAQQIEFEAMCLSKPPIRLGIVKADADDPDVGVVVVALRVAEAASFSGASGSASFRKEPQQNLVPAKAGKRHDGAIGGGQREVGGFLSSFQHPRERIS